MLFQPTLPRGERLASLIPLLGLRSFQPTLPRGERHKPVKLLTDNGIISTHAPARGATDRSEDLRTGFFISTHAPARGATAPVAGALGYNMISTHAPAGGATEKHTSQMSGTRYFNPRSRGGSDLDSQNRTGVRCNFNPRSRGGSDRRILLIAWDLIYISTHAPAGGATASCKCYRLSGNLFQPTLPRGERLQELGKAIIKLLFQPTLPRGERQT